MWIPLELFLCGEDTGEVLHSIVCVLWYPCREDFINMLLQKVTEVESVCIFVNITFVLKSVVGTGRCPAGLAYTIANLYCQLVWNGDCTSVGVVQSCQMVWQCPKVAGLGTLTVFKK